MIKSTKRYTGMSTCFRQHRAKSHCKFLHGYAVTVEIEFEGDLDERNWVWDYGENYDCLMRFPSCSHIAEQSLTIPMNIRKYIKYLFDHTVCVAKDDPQLEVFKMLDMSGLIRLRVFDHVGMERFAEFVHREANKYTIEATDGRVEVARVVMRENEYNGAISI